MAKLLQEVSEGRKEMVTIRGEVAGVGSGFVSMIRETKEMGKYL